MVDIVRAKGMGQAADSMLRSFVLSILWHLNVAVRFELHRCYHQSILFITRRGMRIVCSLLPRAEAALEQAPETSVD